MKDSVAVFLEIQREIQTLTRKLAQFTKTNAQRLEEEWLRSDQAIKILGISYATFKRLISSGTLPYSQINRITYVRSADIESLLKDHFKLKEFKKHHDEPIKYK